MQIVSLFEIYYTMFRYTPNPRNTNVDPCNNRPDNPQSASVVCAVVAEDDSKDDSPKVSHSSDNARDDS